MATSGDSGRRPATVRLRLTSEGSLVRTQLRPPGGFGPDGKRLRRKVSGKTKQEVRDKLKVIHAELDAGLQPSPGYTVQAAVDAWLEHGLSGHPARRGR
jgi:hypothetical protein